MVEPANDRRWATSNDGAEEVTVTVSTAPSPKVDISVDLR